MSNGTKWLSGGILVVIVVVVVLSLLNLSVGILAFLLKPLIVLAVVAAVAIFVRNLFARARSRD